MKGSVISGVLFELTTHMNELSFKFSVVENSGCSSVAASSAFVCINKDTVRICFFLFYKQFICSLYFIEKPLNLFFYCINIILSGLAPMSFKAS